MKTNHYGISIELIHEQAYGLSGDIRRIGYTFTSEEDSTSIKESANRELIDWAKKNIDLILDDKALIKKGE